MNAQFAAVVDTLHPAFERLMAQKPCAAGLSLPKGRVAGIYLFSEFGRHLYVGRTNDLRARYRRHCNPGATHNQAAFAMRLAREKTGRIKATYRPEGSRKALSVDPEFAAAFTEAKAAIRRMDFRYVEEADPLRQCLLETYCAVVLETPYNDFDNH